MSEAPEHVMQFDTKELN